MKEGMTLESGLSASMKELKPGMDSEQALERGHEVILLVDDETDIIDVTREILAILGYHVLVARSGAEAIAFYQSSKEKVDLVILDLIMPGMGGGETFDRLKSINPEVKVIVASGANLSGQAKLIIARGCNGFIQKPFKMQELSKKIRKILD
jgi:two-component system, cell cycle sensor histidine kinase and response regulator CckA